MTDQRHHLRIKSAVLFVDPGICVKILRYHFAVAVKVVEAVLIIVAVYLFKRVGKSRMLEPVYAAAERFIPVIIRGVPRVEIIGRIPVVFHDIRQGKRQILFKDRFKRVFVLDRIASQNRHGFGMIGFIARDIIRHRHALACQGIQRRRIFGIDPVPLARLDHDEHDILPVKHARHDLIASAVRRQIKVLQRRTSAALGKIRMQRLYAFGNIFVGQIRFIDIRDKICYVLIIKTECTERPQRFCRDELRRIKIAVVLVNIHRIVIIGADKGAFFRKIQKFGKPRHKQRKEQDKHGRLPVSDAFDFYPAAYDGDIRDLKRQYDQKYPDDIVIGADTIVYFEDEVIGKAQDERMARHILERLSHQKHLVYTAVAIYIGHDIKTFCEKTEVYFRDISSLIPDYLASKEWVGKAGAYGIQGKAVCFVDHIVGDLDNVIGLPVTKVMECLHQK